MLGVLDKPKLQLIFTGVASLVSAAAPIILLLGAESSAGSASSAV